MHKELDANEAKIMLIDEFKNDIIKIIHDVMHVHKSIPKLKMNNGKIVAF